ncbi:MAG: hypothetical protein EZS28_017082 [Streblomastix strix]|uniref:Uncharacterized protein n=1 Tax=Streblomastix strix TaxID=222440 RepID=A0A5J4VYG1_9EUKA|nr:MAG: hypothetical protein EZS28_017082 [Streblomastix strix]
MITVGDSYQTDTFVAIGIFSKIKSFVSKIGHGLSWMNEKIVKPIVTPEVKQFSGLMQSVAQIIKGIEARSSALDAFNGQ